ncbi:protein FAR-RED IMPAIRED RESPONSE 1-like [Beta vulgaris subsp. vulgaris]|uniref:protein FAR-RED IMPAIRED RESPONSE 1-like n=1 Tax=Beta vulgaris subsp. vulgaris TaxID=3555 RepID=UPI0025483A24|nr:protein FAR-RED IMPAIRED RESPONSE 1-like [Beta vulgaris subsp. vulgaris]
MKDVLWVDARSRAAYEYFGDVVCFDATYLTNDYALPFDNFVGVNHHGQSILLGCALISHEDAESYTWVFSTWVKCMGGKAPNCFLTDQDAAMWKALVNVMPGTWHRWCLWHILMKFGKKLGLYEERMMWAPACMKHIFWASMKTTQHSECINSFFDGYVHKNTKLCDFAKQYCNAMESRANSEKVADANSSRYVRQLATDCKAEVVFQKLYTDGKFKEVQAECLKMLYVHWRRVQKLTHNIEEHTFTDRIWVICKDTKKKAACGEVDLVVEALKLLDDRINERKALKITSNGPKEDTPSSVGNNTIRQDVTPGSVDDEEACNSESDYDEGHELGGQVQEIAHVLFLLEPLVSSICFI